MSKPTIGAHILVKNEADLLPRCLASLKDADEILVIDTGSTDDSIAIAAAHGALIIPSPWNQHFSEPRNRGLHYAKSDWILIVDADETVTVPFESIRDLIHNTEAEAYTVLIHNFLDDAKTSSVTHPAIRLFRNRPEYRFEGRIHEQIEPAIHKRSLLLQLPAHSGIQSSDITLEHVGYTPEWMTKKNKTSRNEAILQLELDQQPNHPFYLYHMGITKCHAGDTEAAGILMKRSLELTPETAPYRSTLIKDLAKIHLHQQDYDTAAVLLQEAIEEYPDYPDLYVLLGHSLEPQALLEQALAAYHQAAAQEPPPGSAYVMEDGSSTYVALTKIGDMLLRLQHKEEAAKQYYSALRHQHKYMPALRGLASSLHQLSVPENEIDSLLRNHLNPNQTEDAAALIEILYSIKAHSSLKTFQLPASDPLPLKAVLQLASSCMLTAQPDKALQLLSGLRQPSSAPDLNTYLEVWALCRWNGGGQLDEAFTGKVPPEIQPHFMVLDQYLGTADRAVSPITPDNGFVELAHRLLEKAVYFDMKPITGILSRLLPDGDLRLAKLLYRKGALLPAADLFLTRLEQERLDDEGCCFLSSILAERGHYNEAASLLEQLRLSENYKNECIPLTLALCYLRLAETALMQLIDEYSSQAASQTSTEELKSIRSSIETISRCLAYHEQPLQII